MLMFAQSFVPENDNGWNESCFGFFFFSFMSLSSLEDGEEVDPEA